MGITRNDVARKAGVSTAVVSYVLNNGPRAVSPDTREKVMEAIRELGYHTNYVARSLRAQRTHTLGLIIPDGSNTFFSEVAKGIEDKAYAKGYSLIMGNTNDIPSRQTSYVESFVSRKVDGMIFNTVNVVPYELDILERYNIPAVYVSPEGEINEEIRNRFAYISIDSENGGYFAGKHLLEKGHTRLACITGGNKMPGTELWSWHRINGFMRAMQAAGISVPVLASGEHPEDGYQVGYKLLNAPDRPTAIFTGNDLLAIGVLRAASDLGLRVPDDLAVCGFDDIELASYVTPRLTSVRIEKYQLGWQAVSMLLERLEEIRKKIPGKDNPTELRYQSFNSKLVIREST